MSTNETIEAKRAEIAAIEKEIQDLEAEKAAEDNATIGDVMREIKEIKRRLDEQNTTIYPIAIPSEPAQPYDYWRYRPMWVNQPSITVCYSSEPTAHLAHILFDADTTVAIPDGY